MAIELLARFFAEESFDTPRPKIARNFRYMLNDNQCWSALALEGATVVGIVTVTTMRYVEWGLLGEIGDLYVLPDYRRRGVAANLVEVAVDWCHKKGCSAVSVTITPEGEKRHTLSRFYSARGFEGAGRTIMSRRLPRARNAI